MDYSLFTFTIFFGSAVGHDGTKELFSFLSSHRLRARKNDERMEDPTPMFRPKGPRIASIKCPGCKAEHPEVTLAFYLYICPACKRYLGMPSQARIALISDAGTFRELDRKLVSKDPLKFVDSRSYRERLREARLETGAREAVTTGLCMIGGQPVVLVVFDFRFLGGTMGSIVGEKVASAFEEAIKRRIPLVSVAASGGARVQEGMFSLMQMAKVAAAASLHDRAGLIFVSILTDPTFGGVTASFASLGDVIIAEPGAQIGFVGPRVIEQTTGVPPPKDSHHAETLLRAGLIDLVVARPDLPAVVAYLTSRFKRVKSKQSSTEEAAPTGKGRRLPAWQQVGLARHAGRPTARHYISRITSHFLELHGDRWGGDDPAIIGGLAEIDGKTVIIVAQERGGTAAEKEASHRGMAYPEGYRKALRLMQLAAKFGIPVVTLIDCPNAQSSYDSEHRGIANALARNLAGMSSLPTPIVAAIIGEGGSGGALALGVADRILMLEHAIYSVISPEGAAAILFRDAGQAESVSEVLKLTAHDLHSFGIIDVVVPEPEGGAHLDPDGTATALKRQILASLAEIDRIPTRRLLAERYKKFRHIGRGGIFWREVVRNKIRDAFGILDRLRPGEPRAHKRTRGR
jgi:acetyl-CoA carboxylase carboxyl transferase alpha subunit/acetyl-CoA carboxylase carboxyl transferase beta subunit